MKFKWIAICRVELNLLVEKVSRKCVLLEELDKEPPQMMKIPKCLDVTVIPATQSFPPSAHGMENNSKKSGSWLNVSGLHPINFYVRMLETIVWLQAGPMLTSTQLLPPDIRTWKLVGCNNTPITFNHDPDFFELFSIPCANGGNDCVWPVLP